MLLVTFHLTKEYTSHHVAGYLPTTKQHAIPPRCGLLTHYKIACCPIALRVTFPLLKNTLTNAIRIITTHHQKNTPHHVAGYFPLRRSTQATSLWVTFPLQNSMLSYRIAGYFPTTKEHANQRNTDYNHTPPEEHTPPRCGLLSSHYHTPPRCGL